VCVCARAYVRVTPVRARVLYKLEVLAPRNSPATAFRRVLKNFVLSELFRVTADLSTTQRPALTRNAWTKRSFTYCSTQSNHLKLKADTLDTSSCFLTLLLRLTRNYLCCLFRKTKQYCKLQFKTLIADILLWH